VDSQGLGQEFWRCKRKQGGVSKKCQRAGAASLTQPQITGSWGVHPAGHGKPTFCHGTTPLILVTQQTDFFATALVLENSVGLWEGGCMNLDDLRLKLTAVFEPALEGGYTCHFEEMPEIFSEGDTVEQAKANLLDALTQVMEYHREEARKNPIAGAMREEFELAAL
jgi:predicted RNase H-like HicB family nuclease